MYLFLFFFLKYYNISAWIEFNLISWSHVSCQPFKVCLILFPLVSLRETWYYRFHALVNSCNVQLFLKKMITFYIIHVRLEKKLNSFSSLLYNSKYIFRKKIRSFYIDQRNYLLNSCDRLVISYVASICNNTKLR